MGFNSLVPYWSCQKCSFEGPLCTVVNVADSSDKKKKKGKEEKIFDPKVRVSNGGGVRVCTFILGLLKSAAPHSMRHVLT
jgi:hypothetical protein